MLAKPGMNSIATRLPGWRGVLVLNYHRIGDRSSQPWDRSLWNASATAFDSQLATLARDAEVVGPDDVEAAMYSQRRGRRVLLTFDDGYRDNYEIAYPLLRRHGLSATFFLATGFLDDPRVPWWDELAWMVRHARADALPAGDWLAEPLSLDRSAHETAIGTLTALYKTLRNERAEGLLDWVAATCGSGRCEAAQAAELFMTWDMARELRQAGMTIGGHTVSHPVLARIPVQRQIEEIATCAERLEGELGESMRWFAYPVGAVDTFTEDTKRILREQGVRLAFSFYGGLGRFSRWDPMDVPRVHVGQGYGPELMRAMVRLPQLFAR